MLLVKALMNNASPAGVPEPSEPARAITSAEILFETFPHGDETRVSRGHVDVQAGVPPKVASSLSPPTGVLIRVVELADEGLGILGPSGLASPSPRNQELTRLVVRRCSGVALRAVGVGVDLERAPSRSPFAAKRCAAIPVKRLIDEELSARDDEIAHRGCGDLWHGPGSSR